MPAQTSAMTKKIRLIILKLQQKDTKYSMKRVFKILELEYSCHANLREQSRTQNVKMIELRDNK